MHRVAILGAGPAGISLAWHLRRISGLEVEVFDAADTIGGQSVTCEVDGVSVELGTCYLTTGYRIAMGIAEEVGCPAEGLPPATVLDAAGAPIDRGSPDLLEIAEFERLWWRWYRAGQMTRPTEPDNALRFDAWLDKNGLGRLAGEFIFTAGLTAQLYGPIPAVTAHSALTWLRPSLFLTGELGLTAAIPRGFQTLWTKAAARTGATVHLGVGVRGLAREGARWRLDTEGAPSWEPFDQVFVACPLDQLEHPLSAALRDRFGPFESTAVYSAVWRARNWPEAAPSRCYLPACSTGEWGRILTIRRNGGADGWSVGQLCAYAREGVPIEAHRAAVRADAEGIVGLRDPELPVDRLWRYNVRYSPRQLEEGLPGVIDDAQGAEGVWYSGGALSHWDVDAITDFNYALVQRYAKQIGAPLLEQLSLWRWDGPLLDL